MSKKNSLSKLVIKAQSGDSGALNELFSSCYNDIYYFALKSVKNEELAYDITQEACMDIFKNISNLKDPDMFVAWSKQITYNRCAGYFRKNKEILADNNEDDTDLFDSIEDDDKDFIPDEALDRDDFRATIMNMINGLSEEQRTAVMLYYFDELSVSEIAQIQGTSEGTVKSRLNYARKSIKSAVEDYENKNDVKLHSLSILPLLLWLRGGDIAGLSIPAAGNVLQNTLFPTQTAVGTTAANIMGSASPAPTAGATAANAMSTPTVGTAAANAMGTPTVGTAATNAMTTPTVGDAAANVLNTLPNAPSSGAQVTNTVSSALSNSSAGVTAANTMSVVADTTATIAGATTASGVAAAATKGIAGKIIAIVCAAAVAIGGGAIAFKVISDRNEEKELSDSLVDDKASDIGKNNEKDEDTPESGKDPDKKEEAPKDYSSESLEPYGLLYNFKDDFVKMITNSPKYFVTKDGSIYDLFDTSAPLYTAPSPDHVYGFFDNIAYVNDKGNLISEFFGTDKLIGNISGEVVAVHYTGLLSQYVDIITKDSAGHFYYTSYNADDMSVSVETKPLAVYNSVTEELISNIVDVEICYNSIYDEDKVYIITDDMIYLSNSLILSNDGGTIMYSGTPVTNKVERVIDSKKTEDKDSPAYVKDGNETNIYCYTDGSLVTEYAISLPEGYTASQVVKYIDGYHTSLFVFSDGSVYTYGGHYGAVSRKIDYLSDLYKKGHIVDFYMVGQNIFDEDFDIVVLMDDNGLYTYKG